MSSSGGAASGSVELPPDPASAGRARRLVAELLAAHGLEACLDEATLLVSELVTNAVVHAASELSLSCRVVRGRLRLEVRDRSLVLPGVRHYDEEAMTGRGLALVAVLSSDWGVEVHGDGKTVWCELEPQRDAVDSASTTPPTVSAPAAPWFPVRFRELPVALMAATVQYTDAVLREFVLMVMDTEEHAERPDWQASPIDLSPLLAVVDEGRDAGQATMTVEAPFPKGAGRAALERLALAEEAERLAREGALLTPPAPPEVALCRRWMLTQVGLQEEGADPEAWELPAPEAAVIGAAVLEDSERARLDQLATAVVVADDGNRIVHANRPAATLLGWEIEDLVGRRLVTIVPHEFREAHLAGFTHYLLTGEKRLLDRDVRVPALRGDGSRLEVWLRIRASTARGDRPVFVAEFRAGPAEPAPVDDR